MAYNRAAAVAYAHRYAYARNPAYGTFDEIGGDCANFVSQCLYAGGFDMQPGPNGWYYRSMKDRAPAWTGVFFLKRFLLTNQAGGPRGARIDPGNARAGDIMFLDFLGGGAYTHSGIVVGRSQQGNILIAAHTTDCDYKPMDEYLFRQAVLISPAD